MENIEKKIMYVREKELQKIFSVSRQVTRAWRLQGAPFLKINRAVLYPLELFNEWVMHNAANTVNFLIYARKNREFIEKQNSENSDLK